MAAGSLTTAALRHRPRQALLIAALAAVVGGAAVLGPLYSRAVEESVVRTVLTGASIDARTITAASSGNEPPTVRRLNAAVAGTSPLVAAPIGGAETAVTVRGAAARGGRPVSGSGLLAARDRLCAHLTLIAGRCPSPAGSATSDAAGAPVAVSRRDATAFGITVGQRLQIADANAPATRLAATVAGIYAPFDPSTPYWAGRDPAASIPPASATAQASQPPALDAVFTDGTTLEARSWTLLRTHVDLPVRVERATLSTLPALRALTRRVDDRARTVEASATSGLPDLLPAIDRERDQTRTVIPLLAVQLALLGVVVLGFVCAAATEVRRPEVALARLRGQRAGAAAGLLLRELGLLVAVGALLGGVLGWFVSAASARAWLAPGTHLEVTPPVLLAAAAAVAVGLLAVAVTALPTLRQPLTALLRRVPPRASAVQVGVVEGALVAATAAGLVTLLAAGTDGGGSRGPVALLAPGLLAVAGGLLLAQLVVPVAGPLARRALGRGRLAGALAGSQVARRPALRRLIAIITVACALLVFAVDTWAVADRHRTTVAGLQAGAPVVLEVSARDARQLRDVVHRADPSGRYATPVVMAGNPAGGPRTLAVVPRDFARIARWGGSGRAPAAARLAALHTTRPPSIILRGTRVTARVTADITRLNKKSPLLRPTSLVLHLVGTAHGDALEANLGALTNGTRTYTAALPCATGCLLRQVEARRAFGDFIQARVILALTRLGTTDAAGRTTAVALGPRTNEAWQSLQEDDGSPDVAVQPQTPLSFVGDSFAEPLIVQRGDVPITPNALAAGSVIERDVTGASINRATSPDLSGIDTHYAVVGRLPTLPRYGNRGALVDLDEVVAGAGAPTSYDVFSVWLARVDAPREKALVRALADGGVDVRDRDTQAAHEARLRRQGPTLALRLALLAGVVGLVLAAVALPIGVATSGGSRARDLAALRIVGVPARAVRAAAVREHLVVAVLGTVAGSVLGLLAAQAVLPRVPLVVGPVPRLPIVRDPAWSPVALAALACLVLLVATSVVVGRTLAGSARPGLLRSGR